MRLVCKCVETVEVEPKTNCYGYNTVQTTNIHFLNGNESYSSM